MRQWNLLMIMVLCLPLVHGEVWVQYSEDNVTWRNVSVVYQDYDEAIQDYLENDVQYYGRARNGSTGEWAYITFTTNEGVDIMSMTSIFHLLTYAALTAAVLLFIIFMHVFNKREYQLSPIIFGSLASALSIIMVAMLASGFSIVHNVSFIIDINYYFMIIYLGLTIYTATASVSLYREIRPKDERYYYG